MLQPRFKSSANAGWTPALWLLCSACDPSSDSGADSDFPLPDIAGKADALGDQGYATRNEQARLLRGFHPLIDRADSTCVKTTAEGPAHRVGSDRESFRMELVDNRETLARALGIDLGLKVKYMGRTGSGEFSFLDELELSQDSLTLLITAEYSYAVSAAQDVDLTADAHSVLLDEEGDPDWAPAWFANRCGTGYVSGIRYASSFSALVTIETNGEKHAQTVAGKLGFGGGIGVVSLNADVGSQFSQTITDQDLTASVDYLGEGFRIPGGNRHSDLPDEVAGEFGAESVERFVSGIEALRENVRRSKEFDRCLDVGDSTCTFIPVVPDAQSGFVEDRNTMTTREAPGYDHNVDRAVTVREVGLASYRTLPSMPPSRYWVLDDIADSVSRARSYLTDYAELDERMTAIHKAELQAFARDKTAFNVAAPGEPVRDLPSLQALNDRWGARFAPRTTVGIGALMADVEQRQKACWESAKRNTFEDCASPVTRCEPVDEEFSTGSCGFVEVAGEDTCMWCEVEDALLTYAETERSLPVRYTVSEAVPFGDRALACRQFDTDFERYRLATEDEARRLAVAVGFGPVNWDERGRPHEVWLDAEPANCPEGYRPVYRNDPADSEDAFECAPEPSGWFSDLERSALCVPSDGPMATVALP